VAKEERHVCAVGGEVAVGLFVNERVGNMCGFVAERGEDGFVLTGEVVAECGGDGVGECECGDLVVHGAGVTLGSDEASEGEWGVAACHDGFHWPVSVEGDDGVYM
jgi:hypothetical protein